MNKIFQLEGTPPCRRHDHHHAVAEDRVATERAPKGAFDDLTLAHKKNISLFRRPTGYKPTVRRGESSATTAPPTDPVIAAALYHHMQSRSPQTVHTPRTATPGISSSTTPTMPSFAAHPARGPPQSLGSAAGASTPGASTPSRLGIRPESSFASIPSPVPLASPIASPSAGAAYCRPHEQLVIARPKTPPPFGKRNAAPAAISLSASDGPHNRRRREFLNVYDDVPRGPKDSHTDNIRTVVPPAAVAELSLLDADIAAISAAADEGVRYQLDELKRSRAARTARIHQMRDVLCTSLDSIADVARCSVPLTAATGCSRDITSSSQLDAQRDALNVLFGNMRLAEMRTLVDSHNLNSVARRRGFVFCGSSAALAQASRTIAGQLLLLRDAADATCTAISGLDSCTGHRVGRSLTAPIAVSVITGSAVACVRDGDSPEVPGQRVPLWADPANNPMAAAAPHPHPLREGDLLNLVQWGLGDGALSLTLSVLVAPLVTLSSRYTANDTVKEILDAIKRTHAHNADVRDLVTRRALPPEHVRSAVTNQTKGIVDAALHGARVSLAPKAHLILDSTRAVGCISAAMSAESKESQRQEKEAIVPSPLPGVTPGEILHLPLELICSGLFGPPRGSRHVFVTGGVDGVACPFDLPWQFVHTHNDNLPFEERPLLSDTDRSTSSASSIRRYTWRSKVPETAAFMPRRGPENHIVGQPDPSLGDILVFCVVYTNGEIPPNRGGGMDGDAPVALQTLSRSMEAASHCASVAAGAFAHAVQNCRPSTGASMLEMFCAHFSDYVSLKDTALSPRCYSSFPRDPAVFPLHASVLHGARQ